MSDTAVAAKDQPKWRHYGLWALQILAALAFLAAGGAKLAGAERMVGMFETLGFGQWFRFVTGGLEVIGALLLLAPRTAWLGGALLAVVMVGAVFTHLVLIGGSFVPALALLVITGTVAYFRRPAEVF